MNIQFVDVKSNKIRNFASFATSDILLASKMEGIQAIGAVMESDNGNTPLGLIQYSLNNKECELLWIYVDPDFRSQKVGSKLISYMHKDSLNRGISSLKALLYDGISKTFNLKDMTEFLQKLGFAISDHMNSVWCFTAKTLFLNDSLPKHSNNETEYKHVRAFSEMTTVEIADATEQFELPKEKMFVNLDREFSNVYFKGIRCHGIVISKHIGNTILLKSFVDDDNLIQDTLFSKVFSDFSQKLRYSTKILIKNDLPLSRWISQKYPKIHKPEAVLMVRGLQEDNRR